MLNENMRKKDNTKYYMRQSYYQMHFIYRLKYKFFILRSSYKETAFYSVACLNFDVRTLFDLWVPKTTKLNL